MQPPWLRGLASSFLPTGMQFGEDPMGSPTPHPLPGWGGALWMHFHWALGCPFQGACLRGSRLFTGSFLRGTGRMEQST